MLGASKAIASATAVQTYSVFITPSQIFSLVPPGSATSAIATANVTGEVGPMTFSWVRLSGDSQITATSPTNDQTTFRASGSFGEEFEATFEVTATDTGNGNLTTTDTIFVRFTFELV